MQNCQSVIIMTKTTDKMEEVDDVDTQIYTNKCEIQASQDKSPVGVTGAKIAANIP